MAWWQVGTSDGRVKLFGKEGVEVTLHSSSRKHHATRQLLFLQNKGIVIRISQVGGWCGRAATPHLQGGGARILPDMACRRQAVAVPSSVGGRRAPLLWMHAGAAECTWNWLGVAWPLHKAEPVLP